MKSVWRYFLLAMILASCTKLQLAYRFADEYMLHQANSFFDLSSEQYKTYKAKVEDDLGRIKKNEGPEVIAFLRSIKTDIEKKDLNGKKVESRYDEGVKLASRIIHEFDSTALDISRSLSDKQIENFKSEYNERLDDYKEDLDTPTEKYAHQKKRYFRMLREWIGNLTIEQEKQLDTFIRTNPYPYDQQIKNRQEMRDKYIQVRKDPKKLNDFLSHIETDKDAAYDQAMKAYTPAFQNFIFNIYNSLTDQQRRYLLGRIDTRISQIEDITSL